MRVDTKTVEVTVYYFSEAEREFFRHLNVWGIIQERLQPYERIEIE